MDAGACRVHDFFYYIFSNLKIEDSIGEGGVGGMGGE